MVRQGKLAPVFEGMDPPYVPGMDVSGTIDELDENVPQALGLEIGMEVVAVVNNSGGYGAYSEYICVPAQSVAPIPDGTDVLTASSFLMNALTARRALDELALPTGSSLLVTGAAGAVGAYVVALAAAEGLHVVALASASDESFVRSLGSSECIDFVARGANPIEQVRKLIPSGVVALVDTACVGVSIAGALSDEATAIVLRSNADVIWERGIQVRYVSVRSRATDHHAIKQLVAQVSSGLLPIRIAQIFEAADAPSAHRLHDVGGLRGRLLLDFAHLSSLR